NTRSATQESQLWLVDQHLEEGSIIINIDEIIRKTNIKIIRNINITDVLTPPPSQYKNLKVLKLFIDIYYDDFGTYRN
ncbi:175_t:CDS:2, partial [Funneliformis geosporum]